LKYHSTENQSNKTSHAATLTKIILMPRKIIVLNNPGGLDFCDFAED